VNIFLLLLYWAKRKGNKVQMIRSTIALPFLSI